MTEPDRTSWAEAYARQGRSDWGVYKLLAGMPTVSLCHELHYLQMACEKIAKAYRWRDTATDAHALTHEHVAFSKFIESFLGSPSIRVDYERRGEKLLVIRKLCRNLAREVEKLAPAVDRDNSPENAEYPWAQGDRIVVPCDYSYPSLSLLHEAGGRTFLKVLARAFEQYESVQIS